MRAAAELAKRWDVTDDDLAALAAEEDLTLTGDAAARRRQMAVTLIRQWEGGSGAPAARVAIDAVRGDLGLPDHGDQRSQQILTWAADHPPIDRALRSFGRAMYAGTQAWLAEHGLSEVPASRAGFANDKQRPFTSWSLHHGGMRHEPGRVERHETIPARLIMSLPPTGFGTLAESELVVLPGW